MSAPATRDRELAGPPVRRQVRPLVRAPEPAFFWARYAPRRWPPPARPWYDVLRGSLGAVPGARGTAGAGEALAEPKGVPFDDTLWLPPVPAARDGERRRLAERQLAAGSPVLWHLFPGDPPGPPGATALYDLTASLVAAAGAGGDGRRALLDELAALPAGSAALWALIPGISDGEDLWREAFAALAGSGPDADSDADADADAGVAVVQSAVPTLAPADRRRLAEGLEEDAYRRLFHSGASGGAPGAEVDEAAFARAAAAAGLAIFLPRPLPAPPATGRAARHIAACLFLVAELWLRLDRQPSQGQAFFRAARWVDDSSYDPQALAREGNLGVVEVLDEASRRLIEDAVARGGRPALLDELEAEYTGVGPAPSS